MKRCLVAVDVQEHFHPSQGMIQQLNTLAGTIPTATTILTYKDGLTPKNQEGKLPYRDTSRIQTHHTFEKHNFNLPETLINWLKEQNPEEVILAGGHTDANVLGAAFSLYNAGFKTVMVPLLCYGNDWYLHTVTTGIFEQDLGQVFESVAELKFSTI